MPIYFSKKVGGDVVCGCAPDVLFATLAGYQPPACAYYPPVSGYVTYPPVLVDGGYTTTQMTPITWEFGVIDPAVFGSIYSDSGCVVFFAGISGFSATFYISKTGATYTVTALAASGGDLVFNGSGPIDTAISNTSGTGTITLSFI